MYTVYILYMHRHRLVSVCVCARTYVQLQKLSEYSQHVTPRFMKVMIQVASEVGPTRFFFGTSEEAIWQAPGTPLIPTVVQCSDVETESGWEMVAGICWDMMLRTKTIGFFHHQTWRDIIH